MRNALDDSLTTRLYHSYDREPGSSLGLTPNPRCPMVLRKESGNRKLPPTRKDFRFGGIRCH